MSKQIDALKLALEAFKKIRNDRYSHWEVDQEIDAIEEALAQPEKKFVTIVDGPFNHRCPETPLHIKEALAQTKQEPTCKQSLQVEQEPVAWMKEGWGPDCGPYIEFYRDDEMGWRDRKEWTPLYTITPQRKPLTDAQSERLYRNIEPSRQQDARSLAAFKRLLRVIEAAHGIKE